MINMNFLNGMRYEDIHGFASNTVYLPKEKSKSFIDKIRNEWETEWNQSRAQVWGHLVNHKYFLLYASQWMWLNHAICTSISYATDDTIMIDIFDEDDYIRLMMVISEVR